MTSVIDMLKESMSITDDAHKNIDKCCEIIEHYNDQLLPNYFFMGFIFGSEFKDIEKLKEKFKDSREMDYMIKLYEKGLKNVSMDINGIKCSKCEKVNIKEENVKFCKYCGEKL